VGAKLIDQLEQYTSDLVRLGLYRQRHVDPPDEGIVHFGRNDYLSLSMDPRIKNAYQRGFDRYPTSSSGSMLTCGYHSIHKALEDAFSEALGVDDCLLFPSGYAANLSIIALLARQDIHVVVDKMVHASIYDGLQSTGTRYTRYLHNDLTDLSLKMTRTQKDKVLVTEGIFSMSGQSAPLSDIALVCQNDVQGLIIDEAHAFGLLGDQGLGAVSQHQLTQKEVPLRVIPFGKAFASVGAMVAGQRIWIDALLQSARPYIYSTALSPACAYGLLETLEVLRGADERRSKLRSLVNYFREAIYRSPLQWGDSHSPIQQLQLGCPQRALYVSDYLRQQAILCFPMRQPTVSKQHTGLRVILNYHHQPEHIDLLFQCLHQI
jgi:8-amino-7-oxononanoate synthase